uniref:Uncharacterized protein n=1 Tax=Tanacetum cinerariifolium TaxID=118510 RepID=A0A6L2K6J8_TANCI|nr:hypothetical protein [Tanacetum cinerariifolium]
MYNAIASQDYHSAIRLIKKYPNLHRGYVLMAIAQNFPVGRNPDEKKATAMKKILGFFSIIYEILLIVSYLLLCILLFAIWTGGNYHALLCCDMHCGVYDPSCEVVT